MLPQPDPEAGAPVTSLCFNFEAPDLDRALDLADELRRSGDRVRVRPGAPRLLGARRWTVSMMTRPAPMNPVLLRLWEDEMRQMVQRCPGCRFVGAEAGAEGWPPGPGWSPLGAC